MKKRKIFDVMIEDRFVCTMCMPVTLDVIESYNGDEPVVSEAAIRRYVEQKRPTLKYENYRICL